MSRMHVYTVHIQPKKNQPYENPVFISESFNWFAFLFAPFWALYHRLWLLALGIFLYNGLVGFAGEYIGLHEISIGILQLAMQVFIGFHGNDFRRHALKKKGYITADIVTSDNLVRAEQRFFDRYFSTKRKASPAPAANPQRPSATNAASVIG